MSYDHIPGHEYDFAIDQFRLWKHWEKMCESSRFKPYVTTWRAELEILNKAKYVKAIMKAAREDLLRQEQPALHGHAQGDAALPGG